MKKPKPNKLKTKQANVAVRKSANASVPASPPLSAGGDQRVPVAHSRVVAAQPNRKAKTRQYQHTRKGHGTSARSSPSLADGDDRVSCDFRKDYVVVPLSPSPTEKASRELSPNGVVPALIGDLVEVNRLRQDFVQAQGNLDRQIKKIVARFTGKQTVTNAELKSYYESAPPNARLHISKLIALRDLARDTRNEYDKNLSVLATRLPVYASFVEPLNGMGALGLAQIIGEAGADLSNYAAPAKLWRRFGLHVHDGRAFSSWRRSGGLSAEDWSNAGYSPRRRSVIYVIVNSLLKKPNRYKTLCDERKAIERQKAEAAGLIVAAAADIPKAEHAKYRSMGHIKARAERYVGKRLLRDLWRAWRDQHVVEAQRPYVSSMPANPIAGGEAKDSLSQDHATPASPSA